MFDSSRRLGVWIGIALTAVHCDGALAVAPAQTSCPNANVVIEATDTADFEAGCRAAAAASEFLAASGLETDIPIRISFVDVMPDVVAGTAAVGCYVRADNRIYVLAFARCEQRRLAHGVDIDRSVHMALVTHEVAHRIVGNVGQPRLSVVAHEYIASVTMYATMQDSRRQQVLKQIPGDGFASDREIDITTYLIDPVYFGAQAYRHYLKPGIGGSFIARVLKAQVLIE